MQKLRDTNPVFEDQHSLAFTGDGNMLSLVDILFIPGIPHNLFDYLNAAEINFMIQLMEMMQI